MTAIHVITAERAQLDGIPSWQIANCAAWHHAEAVAFERRERRAEQAAYHHAMADALVAVSDELDALADGKRRRARARKAA